MWLLERVVNVGRRICLGDEHVSKGDFSVVVVSACQAISMMKELVEGAEDGFRDTLSN